MAGSRQLDSWGRVRRARRVGVPVVSRDEPLPASPEGTTLLPYGLGRSYGDSCLNDDGALLLTRGLDRLISFDRATGVVRCESGVTLAQVLHLALPQGWFLPVTPGTKFVTLGGAIANDVHGKNHHAAGTLGRYVRAFELLRSDGSRLLCTPEQNAEWFGATIGGLGLTGLITWAELQLRPVANGFIEAESVKFGSLDEFFAINRESEASFEYTVAWVDCLARGASLGRGLYNRGNHAPVQLDQLAFPRLPRKLSVPIDLPSFAMTRPFIQAFNTLYFHKQRRRITRGLQSFEPFFYPLDAVLDWNRIYGSRGFFQYQFVVPHGDSHDVVREIFTRIAHSGQGSFLAVLKTFGDLPSPGWLSFPRPGVTLALDFPNRGGMTLDLFDDLDRIVLSAGGAVYPAKDARMSAASFRRFFPQWEKLVPYVDPRFSSGFWKRVTEERAVSTPPLLAAS